MMWAQGMIFYLCLVILSILRDIDVSFNDSIHDSTSSDTDSFVATGRDIPSIFRSLNDLPWLRRSLSVTIGRDHLRISDT